MISLTVAALHAAAPRADPGVWLPVLTAAFDRWDINTPRRVAAALGQFAVEAGDDFGELRECLNYTHAERIAAVWPSVFPTVATARPYIGNPEMLANRVYANKLGNGPEATGDGWAFRGRGMIQITGRDEYRGAWAALGDHPVEWFASPEGAALSGAWYFTSRGCLSLADQWMLTAITKRVNGAAMLGLRKRREASNRALDTLIDA